MRSRCLWCMCGWILNDFLKLEVDEVSRNGRWPFSLQLCLRSRSQRGRQPGDLLITKRHWGAFAGTKLEEQLKSRGIETVVIMGISTNIGVESTVRQGTGLGFHFVVVEDACSAQNAEHHKFSMEHIFPRAARVRSTDEVLATIA